MAGGGLEAILLRLGLDASGFSKGAKDATKDLGVLENGVKSLKHEMEHLAAGVAAGVGFAVLVHEALDFAEAVTVVANRTGLATDSVQYLRFIAEQTGTSVDSLANMVNKLQKQMVEAGDNPKLQKQLEDLVGPIVNLRALKPEDQLQAVANAIANLNDPAERSAAAVAAFGKSGAESIPMLVEMAQKQDDLAEAFQRTGGAVSEDAIHSVKGLEDGLLAAKTSVVALATELLGALAPAFRSFFDTVTEVVAGLRLLDGQGSDPLVNLDNKITAAKENLDQLKASAYAHSVACATAHALPSRCRRS
jgi:hypothetical protein